MMHRFEQACTALLSPGHIGKEQWWGTEVQHSIADQAKQRLVLVIKLM